MSCFQEWLNPLEWEFQVPPHLHVDTALMQDNLYLGADKVLSRRITGE
jgi:hypothetical protein